jgi:hypothetical protein
MRANNKIKTYVKVIKSNATKLLNLEKKRLVRMGAIILAVITIAGSILIVFKMNNKQHKIVDKPAEIVEVVDDKNNKTNLFLEHVQQLKSGIYETQALVFGEEKMRIDETFGESSKDYVVVQGNFRIKYSIDINRMKLDYNFDTETVVLKVPKDAVGVDSVELLGDITEIEKHESFGVKLKELIPGLNNDEQLKESAIRQLLRNSKVEAQNYDVNEVQEKAHKALKELVDTININNLDYRIEFVDNTKINIK